jgi:hypothetical protein
MSPATYNDFTCTNSSEGTTWGAYFANGDLRGFMVGPDGNVRRYDLTDTDNPRNLGRLGKVERGAILSFVRGLEGAAA